MRVCATPATQNAAASRAPKPDPSAPPSAISATPATLNDGKCEFVPRLPRETKVDVRLCHACHAQAENKARQHSSRFPTKSTQKHVGKYYTVNGNCSQRITRGSDYLPWQLSFWKIDGNPPWEPTLRLE